MSPYSNVPSSDGSSKPVHPPYLPQKTETEEVVKKEGEVFVPEEQDVKKSGKTTPFTKIPKRLRPSHTSWKRTHTGGKIFALFEQILHLIQRIAPHPPAKIDYRLFHNLTSSNESLRTAMARAIDTEPRFSEVLDTTIRFFGK